MITFPTDVALPSTYLNDVRFDLGRSDAGIAYINDSSDFGPNGIIVVDLASGASWRRLHDHPSTKAESVHSFRPVVEGRPFLERPADRPPRPVTIGSDGIAISADGSRLHYCPLASRRWYSVATDALADRTLTDAEVAATVVDEGDKGGGSDGLETDDAGRLYLTSYENNAVLRRRPDGEFETVVHDGAAALARQPVRGCGRPPVRHREPAASAAEIPARTRPAPQAVRPVPHPDPRRTGAAALSRPTAVGVTAARLSADAHLLRELP
ncbi:L-dopachrome tautomerase-related protein [Micromonospora sp. IBSANI012]|uniref:L-dopachrome tautomerase-related protein n=1 Tax=Micromonospora sp. IBSANI012 TaxID=3457761 RepID=UPI004057E250